MDRAWEWAESTLSKAGLPSKPGFYALQPDGNIILTWSNKTDPRATDNDPTGHWAWPGPNKPASWTGNLPSAVHRLGHEPGSPEHIAARLIQLLSDLSVASAQHEVGKASTLAFYAGMLWQQRFNDKAIKAGTGLVKFRQAGAKANIKYDEEITREWFFEALRREDKEGIKDSRPQAARLIAMGKGYGASDETIRKAIDRHKRRMREK
jgi:hypothetical protein